MVSELPTVSTVEYCQTNCTSNQEVQGFGDAISVQKQRDARPKGKHAIPINPKELRLLQNATKACAKSFCC